MLALRKLLKLPSPKELGRSEYNALPSRDWSPDCTGYSWEDWHAEVKAMYPIKYWIAETASDYIRFKIWFPISRPIKDAKYWLVSHIIPKHRYHMLDLRQPGEYSHGWQDVPEKILYANFNLLKEYLDEDPCDLSKDYTIEQINADAALKNQYEILREAKDIHEWWTIKRKEDEKIKDELLHRWSELKKNKISRDGGDVDQMRAVLQKAEEDYENKIDDMLARLMKIRRSLWT